jgi:WhiB family redox-sensing transcriptional regulator
MATPRFGFPPFYKIEQTGLFFLNGNTSSNRETPYHFHTNPSCHAVSAVETLEGTSLYEVTIFRNLVTDELFYVKPLDGKTVKVDRCGACETSRFRFIEPAGDWADEGSCNGMDVDIFFPESNGVRPAYELPQRICADCPVVDDCREWALRTHLDYGYAGGTTPTQRRYILRDRARETANA